MIVYLYMVQQATFTVFLSITLFSDLTVIKSLVPKTFETTTQHLKRKNKFERNVRRFSVAFITLLDELQIHLKKKQNILFFDGNLHENLSKNVQVTEIQHSKFVLKKSFPVQK